MPSASDISNVESLVNELLPAGAKPAERAASAVKLAGQAETEAAKYLLLRTAFLSYVKAGEYEKAEEAFDALLEAVPDFPLGDQEDLFSKAMFSVPSKGAPSLRARQAVIKGRVKQLSVVKRIQTSIDKNPANKALYARLGESYVILNDWPKALAAFSKASDPVLAATATHELELKPGAGTSSPSLMKFADYWWDYSSKSSELIAAMRSHAVAIYKLSLPTLTGLNKVRVEKRIKEADEAAVAAETPESVKAYGKASAKSYVQKGLVAQWDAIENAGYGKHISNPREWKDLIGSRAAKLSNNALFDKTGLSLEKELSFALFGGKMFNGDFTLELVFTGKRTSPYNSVFTVAGDTWSLYTGSADSWNLKHTLGGPRPSLTPVAFKPLVVVCRGGELRLRYADGSGKDGVVKVGGGEAESNAWSFGGQDQSHALCGKFYAVRYYNRALTDAEISTNNKVDKRRFDLQ